MDYMVPDFLKLMFAVCDKPLNAEEDGFDKLEKCSKYQLDQMMRDKGFGLKEEFYLKLKVTPT